jgi:hypothetical protein
MLFAPIAGDRSHLDAARGGIGLRNRSAGAAAEMLEVNGHWNETRWHGAYCRGRAKHEFFCDGEDCVTL